MGRHEREELARFLRAKREKVHPADVGLPAGQRRRSTGLRREEVAVLAGLSPTWYTYLEQARKINPSTGVLDSLCRVLSLSASESRYVYELAYGREFAPPAAVTTEADHPAGLIASALVRGLGDFPFPVYCFDASGLVLVANTACGHWLSDFVEERNIVRWMFLSVEARERFTDWETEARNMLARFRAYQARSAVRAERERMVEELYEESPTFRSLWDAHEVQGQFLRTRSFRHPTFGPYELQVGVFRPADDPTISVAFHYPADAAPALGVSP